MIRAECIEGVKSGLGIVEGRMKREALEEREVTR